MDAQAESGHGPAAAGRVGRRRERTRRALVAAGLHQFLGRGPRAVSVEQLLAEADISRATFYKIFSSKNELLEYILDPVYEFLLRRIAELEACSDADVVDGLVEAWMAAHAEHGDALVLLARLHASDEARLPERRAVLVEATLAALARAERADVLRNASARYSAELVARVVAPLLEVYAGRPGADALIRDALNALLKRRH